MRPRFLCEPAISTKLISQGGACSLIVLTWILLTFTHLRSQTSQMFCVVSRLMYSDQTPASCIPRASAKRDQLAEMWWCNVVQREERDQFQFHYWPISDSASFGIINNDSIAWNNWASQNHCQWVLIFFAHTSIVVLIVFILSNPNDHMSPPGPATALK